MHIGVKVCVRECTGVPPDVFLSRLQCSREKLYMHHDPAPDENDRRIKHRIIHVK